MPALARLMTIGYEGKSPQAFIDRLVASQVRRIVDVRQLPLSRRRGFSKTALSAQLAEAGIEYLHVRAAGNPFRHDAEPVEQLLARFRSYVSAAPSAITSLRQAVSGAPSALLCFEADPACCHRSVLADLLARTTDGLRVRHL